LTGIRPRQTDQDRWSAADPGHPSAPGKGDGLGQDRQLPTAAPLGAGGRFPARKVLALVGWLVLTALSSLAIGLVLLVGKIKELVE
jgi:hypothetical protein